MLNMEEDFEDAKKIKIEHNLEDPAATGQLKVEPFEEDFVNQQISERDTVKSKKTSVNQLVSIKQEKEDEFILPDNGLECEHTSDQLEDVARKRRRINPDSVSSVIIKEEALRSSMGPTGTESTIETDETPCETASSIAAEDEFEDNTSCISSETLPEHLSDFATPLMEMEVLEADDESRTQNGPRRRRNRSKFVLTRASRGMGKGCENCRSKCHQRITEDQRQNIFEHFWCLEDAVRQWLFIDMHTKTKETERKTTNWQSNRKISRTYYFDVNGAEVKVCQVMFLSTLGVSEKWVRNLTQALRANPGSTGIDLSQVRNELCQVPSGEIDTFPDSFHESLGSTDNCQDLTASSVASEEESTAALAERMGEESDSGSSDSHPGNVSDSATPVREPEAAESTNTSADASAETSEAPSKSRKDRAKTESKWKRGKVMGKGCENCRAKCHLKITEAQRAAFFDDFWNLGDSAKQWQFIAKHTRTRDTERKTTNWHSNRKVTRSYYFNVDNQEVKVCQLMFLSTLGISEKWIKTALMKKDQDLFPDRRGKTRKPFSKLKGPVYDSIIEHVNLFERCQDCHEILNKECLPESLSLRKMFDFYSEFMKAKQRQLDGEVKAKQTKVVLTAATERQYRDVFKKEFNLSFHPPRKGQCERCAAKPSAAAANKQAKSDLEQDSKQDSKRDSKQDSKPDLEEHVRNKDAVREIKDADKVEAVKQPSICLASFESQRIGLPCGDLAEFHYAGRLSVYHFSVFDIGKSQPYGYLWSEEIAKRGSNESASCLKDFVEQRLAFGVVDFRFYSDGCTVLKKTKPIFGLWYYLAKKHSISITHRFLESGHTLTEGHAVLSDIERKVRKHSLYSPEQMTSFIRDIKDTKPSIVKNLDQEEVYDMEDLLSGQNWDTDTSGNPVKWSAVREVQVSGECPGIVKFKYDFLSEYSILEVESVVSGSDYVFKRAYDKKRPLSKAKIDNLMSLCTNNIIPTSRQEFYYRLAASNEDSQESK